MPNIFRWHRSRTWTICTTDSIEHFPTFITALPRLPFALVPFAFSQFILIEALNHQGWVNVFANWLVRASHNQMHPTIWLIGGRRRHPV
jgi:Na+/H+ antiporter NhaD/arsenite permease-like protein